MAILGLLVRNSDTIAGIRERLTAHFPHTGWSESVVYSDLPGLVKQGLVRQVEEGEKRGQDGYEATVGGATHFRQWLRERSEAVPALHDATRARLELCDEEDLPEMLPLLREEQRICAARFDRLRWRLNRARRFGHLGPPDGSEARGRLLHALMTDDMMMWGSRALRLKRLIEAFEGHDHDVEYAPELDVVSSAGPVVGTRPEPDISSGSALPDVGRHAEPDVGSGDG
jgi:DNA-binding PadR family transcriptional regulator